jgi:hypothetical protein
MAHDPPVVLLLIHRYFAKILTIQKFQLNLMTVRSLKHKNTQKYKFLYCNIKNQWKRISLQITINQYKTTKEPHISCIYIISKSKKSWIHFTCITSNNHQRWCIFLIFCWRKIIEHNVNTFQHLDGGSRWFDLLIDQTTLDVEVGVLEKAHKDVHNNRSNDYNLFDAWSDFVGGSHDWTDGFASTNPWRHGIRGNIGLLWELLNMLCVHGFSCVAWSCLFGACL